LIIAAALSVTLVAVPQARAEGSDYKVGVVDVKRVFDNYERQKKEYALLQDERDKKQAEIDKLSDKITEQKDRYDKERDSMSDSEREALEEQIESDYTKYKADFKRLQEDIDRREKKLLETIFEDIHLAVQEVGARGDYHLILEVGQPGRTAVLYHSTTLDSTQQVIDHLNEKYAGGS
jgi:outer membrane protein